MWGWQKIVIFSVPFVLLVFGAVAWLFLRKTIRSRARAACQLRNDPDINEWLVAFGWSRKVLYVPIVLASLVAFVLMLLKQVGWIPGINAGIVGGVWVGIFILNFLVDEYEMNIKVLLIVLLCLIVLFLWLMFMGWLAAFLMFFRHFGIEISAIGYLLLAIIFALAILISWLRGLFYYVAITPNYMNIQTGPTETGEQISREEYSTRIDTGDFLERLLGFGRIVVTFSDQRRQPMMLLVGRIGKKAALLESIRGKLALDRYQSTREGV
ncbi:MAG: hypothetical protein K8R91_04020 [Phycisphaerae bacterium]|nr:hypothetical protein [Phycisphaerae bacterium]